MIGIKSRHLARVANATLRMTSLVAKLCLTLYMGRYLSLADMGVYGLVSGTVIILMEVLGVRLDYVVSREVVGADSSTALIKMRDQALFYGLNYMALAAIMIVLAALDVTGVSGKIMFVIFVLSVVESCANMTYLNIISMGKPLVANMLFFVRSGLWVLPVIGLGLLVPSFRESGAIFIFWALGVIASLVLTLWVWRSMPWHDAVRLPVNWTWIKKGVTRCFFIWVGSVGSTMGFYVARFIVAHNLGLDLAGVATFYSSFTAALFALVQSSVLAFAYPRLIMLHQKHDEDGFRREARNLAWHIALVAGGVAIIMGIVVPLLGRFFHRQILTDEAPTLWLMLFGMWIMCNAATFYYILFARHQDRPIWLGDLLYLIIAFGCNAVLVPLIGFEGIGYSAIIYSLSMWLWRGWHVRYGARAEVQLTER
jgi:O-antigen/teichoic acid export membrane protein